jgi:glyoxylase-like metal-dependent hydrolase (beta-lactamase superfamily II)
MTLVVEQVEPEVTRLRFRTWQSAIAGYEVSAYVVRGVLIDAGSPHARRDLVAAMERLKPRGAIVTHWHEDHAGNAPALAALGIPVLMHARSEATLRERPRIAAYRLFTWGRTPRLESPLRRFDPAPLQVLPSPGHSPDHLIVWDPERRVLVSGDLFLGVKVRIAHSDESPRTLIASLHAAAALEPRIMLDAHRGVIERPGPLLHAKIAWLEETVGAIESLRARGISEREIRQRVLGPEAVVGWASGGEYSKRALVRAVLRERDVTSPRPPSVRTSAAPSDPPTADRGRAARDDARDG